MGRKSFEEIFADIEEIFYFVGKNIFWWKNCEDGFYEEAEAMLDFLAGQWLSYYLSEILRRSQD